MKNPEESSSNTPGAKKRKSSDDGGEEEEPAKKVRKLYKMADEWAELIKADTRNKCLWDQALEKEMYSRTDLLDQVQTVMTCQICFDLPNQQVSTLSCHLLIW